MASESYASVVVANLRAVRARKDLDQAHVVTRMRALGFTKWHRQTISRVENGERRLDPEEILGLAEALGVMIAELLAPADPDAPVRLPSGAEMSGRGVQASVRGDVSWKRWAVRWTDDKADLPPLEHGGQPMGWYRRVRDDEE